MMVEPGVRWGSASRVIQNIAYWLVLMVRSRSSSSMSLKVWWYTWCAALLTRMSSPPRPRDGVGHEGAAELPVADVARQQHARAPLGAHDGGDRVGVHLLLGQVGLQRDVGALACEGDGDRRADPPVATRDQRLAAGQSTGAAVRRLAMVSLGVELLASGGGSGCHCACGLGWAWRSTGLSNVSWSAMAISFAQGRSDPSRHAAPRPAAPVLWCADHSGERFRDAPGGPPGGRAGSASGRQGKTPSPGDRSNDPPATHPEERYAFDIRG